MIRELDEAVAKWAAREVRQEHVPAIRAVTHLGGTEVVVAAGALAAGASLIRRGTWRPALQLALVIGGQNLLHNLIKRITDRRRPEGPHHSFFSGASFPSGHTTTAAASWPAIVETVAPQVGPVLRSVSYVAGPAVGSTRVLLGVHWLSDVVAGLILGYGWLGAVRLLLRRSARGAQAAPGIRL